MSPADVAGVIRARLGRPFLAIQALGEDSGDRGLAHAPRAGEQVGVGHAMQGPNRVAQGLDDVILPHDLGEPSAVDIAGPRPCIPPSSFEGEASPSDRGRATSRSVETSQEARNIMMFRPSTRHPERPAPSVIGVASANAGGRGEAGEVLPGA